MFDGEPRLQFCHALLVAGHTEELERAFMASSSEELPVLNRANYPGSR